MSVDTPLGKTPYDRGMICDAPGAPSDKLFEQGRKLRRSPFVVETWRGFNGVQSFTRYRVLLVLPICIGDKLHRARWRRQVGL